MTARLLAGVPFTGLRHAIWCWRTPGLAVSRATSPSYDRSAA